MHPLLIPPSQLARILAAVSESADPQDQAQASTLTPPNDQLAVPIIQDPIPTAPYHPEGFLMAQTTAIIPTVCRFTPMTFALVST